MICHLIPLFSCQSGTGGSLNMRYKVSFDISCRLSKSLLIASFPFNKPSLQQAACQFNDARVEQKTVQIEERFFCLQFMNRKKQFIQRWTARVGTV
jgi:hypothetical protein